MGLIDDLRTRKSPIALDTCIFIYFIEENPKYLSIVQPVFAAIDAEHISAVTSALTLMETLILPYRLGNMLLAKQYQAFLTKSRGLKLNEITTSTCTIAAQLRAAYGVKTADALQIATALVAECGVFLTNDRTLPQVKGINVVCIEDYLEKSI